MGLSLFLLLSLILIRPYFEVPVAQMGVTKHTHVCTSGTVALVKIEQDGDRHIRLVDGGAFVVLEVIPRLPVAGSDAVKVGDHVAPCGILRFDRMHGWPEIHPVEYLRP